jgi:hypothetical protein
MISKERLRKIIYNNTIFDTATDLNTHYDKHNASIQKDVDRAISSGKMAKAEVSRLVLLCQIQQMRISRMFLTTSH